MLVKQAILSLCVAITFKILRLLFITCLPFPPLDWNLRSSTKCRLTIEDSYSTIRLDCSSRIFAFTRLVRLSLTCKGISSNASFISWIMYWESSFESFLNLWSLMIASHKDNISLSVSSWCLFLNLEIDIPRSRVTSSTWNWL